MAQKTIEASSPSRTALVSIPSICLGFGQLKKQSYTEMCAFNLHLCCFFKKLNYSECFLLCLLLQSHCHCHVQHGPQPLPPGHPNLLTGDWELWVCDLSTYQLNNSHPFSPDNLTLAMGDMTIYIPWDKMY